jgi:hypothetical protein
MATLVCDPNVLAAASACFAPQCIGPDDRESIDVYVRIQELAAIGGINYSGTAGLRQLEQDVRGWYRLDEDTRRRIALYIDIQNALNKGASFPTDINSLRKAASCLLCESWEVRRNMKLYLKCLLNKVLAPE